MEEKRVFIPSGKRNRECGTFSAGSSYWRVFDQKAERAGVSGSMLLRAMIEDFLIDHELVFEMGDIRPHWQRKENKHG